VVLPIIHFLTFVSVTIDDFQTKAYE